MTARALGSPFDASTRFAAMFSTPRQIVDGLWLAAFPFRHEPQPRLHAQPLVRLRQGERPIGLVAVYIGQATPLEPTAVLSVDKARTVAALIEEDDSWAAFGGPVRAGLSRQIEAAADQAWLEAVDFTPANGDLGQ